MYPRMQNRHLTIALLLLGVACNAPYDPCPPKGIGLWSPEGEAEVFAGDDLFVYINGGAEIYHEYGFVDLTVQRYRRGGDRVSVEIYRMDEDAFGIYSFARSGNGRALGLGDGATAADYYLHLWSGREMAAITAENEFEDLSETLIEIAETVAECMTPGGVEPDLLAQLPTDDRVPGTEVYFSGQLAFINVARPAASYFSGFEEGVVARYGQENLTVVMKWRDDREAEQALRSARQRCTESGCTIGEIEDPNTIELASGTHRISARRLKNLIALQIEKEES